jgi:hypothetical protein
VRGFTFLTHGDEYTVLYTDVLLAEGFLAEAPHGNHYAMRGGARHLSLL